MPVAPRRTGSTPVVTAPPKPAATTPNTAPTAARTTGTSAVSTFTPAAKPILSETGQAVPTPADAALRNGLSGVKLPVSSGAKGSPALAIQYALGRLGLMKGLGLADGKFGPKSSAALAQFQKNAGLAVTGALDAKTLAALDAAVSVDSRVAAAKSSDPMGYLFNFKALGVSAVSLGSPAPKASWAEPAVQKAYGAFVKDYWQALKSNKVECDCKTLNLLLMDGFRRKVKEDTGLQLPLPSNGAKTCPEPQWQAMTDASAQGFFKRFENLKSVREGYSAAQAIQKLDPTASMLVGVNVRPGNYRADQVGRAATPVQAWSAAMDNKGDALKSEIPVQQLQPGDMIFIDHGAGVWGHAVNVVDVKRGPDGKVLQAVIATGSFDDMKDSNGSTDPRGGFEINNYTEEVTIDFDASGKVTKSEVTWSSEPSYLVDPRYSQKKLLMELKPNGKVVLANWGARPG